MRKARINKKYTLKELADLIGVSISHLDRLENGLVPAPKNILLYRLSNVLDLDYEILLKHRWSKYPEKLEKVGILI